MNEEKLKEKLAAILKKPAYGSLHTFEHEHLINDVVAAAKDCEEIAEEEEDWIDEEA
jgi:hypothetical protein